MYSLDNLWDGLGALVVKYPHIKYLGGKVTMYRDFNLKARNLILNFLDKRFPDDEGLMKPKYPVE
jgi:hypothetical protein